MLMYEHFLKTLRDKFLKSVRVTIEFKKERRRCRPLFMNNKFA